jgi:hypothetical protein
MKTPVLPINNLQQASTSESESIPTTLPQPVMMNFYALLTPGSDKKLPEEPMKHCQLATKSDTEETSTISALQATQHLNQAKTSRLQMMVHKLRMHRCQRQLTAPHGRGPLTPVLAPPQPPPSSIKKALRLIADNTKLTPIIGFFPHYSHPPFKLSHQRFNQYPRFFTSILFFRSEVCLMSSA